MDAKATATRCAADISLVSATRCVPMAAGAGGSRQHGAGQFIELQIRMGEEALTIESLVLRMTRYPLRVEFTFRRPAARTRDPADAASAADVRA